MNLEKTPQVIQSQVHMIKLNKDILPKTRCDYNILSFSYMISTLNLMLCQKVS